MPITFIIDGSNVAHAGAGRGAAFRNIEAVIDQLQFEYAGSAVKTVVDASLRHALSSRAEADRLEHAIRSGAVIQAPADEDADHFILELARRLGGCVVTLDLYRDRQSQRAGIPMLRPMITDGLVVLGRPCVFRTVGDRRSVECSLASGAQHPTAKAPKSRRNPTPQAAPVGRPRRSPPQTAPVGRPRLPPRQPSPSTQTSPAEHAERLMVRPDTPPNPRGTTVRQRIPSRPVQRTTKKKAWGAAIIAAGLIVAVSGWLLFGQANAPTMKRPSSKAAAGHSARPDPCQQPGRFADSTRRHNRLWFQHHEECSDESGKCFCWTTIHQARSGTCHKLGQLSPPTSICGYPVSVRVVDASSASVLRRAGLSPGRRRRKAARPAILLMHEGAVVSQARWQGKGYLEDVVLH